MTIGVGLLAFSLNLSHFVTIIGQVLSHIVGCPHGALPGDCMVLGSDWTVALRWMRNWPNDVPHTSIYASAVLAVLVLFGTVVGIDRRLTRGRKTASE
jgi:hypothetical protein